MVDGGVKPLAIDLFLETVGKISIGFDKFDNPQMPTMVKPKSQSDKYRKIKEEAENDATAKQRMEAIIVGKKEEFDAEQARRKLVD